MNPGITRRGILSSAGALGAAAAVGSTLGGTLPAAAAAAYEKGSDKPLIGKARTPDLHVMSFNIRYDREGTQPGQPDYWPERKPLVTAFVELEKPTILGVQEAEFSQLGSLEAGLGPKYRMLGFGRDGGAGGEYSSIFYDASRLEALWWDQFWLSDTPDVIASATWGNSVTRIVTWVRFLDLATGTEFLHVNSHFDHQSENARVRSAEVVRSLIADTGLPAVFTADANANAEASDPYTTLVNDGGLVDTWLAGTQLTPQVGTFPNYGTPNPAGTRIDWVLATPDVTVKSAAINTWTKDGRWPSDHTPVQALVRLP
ncbi:endonuclease/exonuclease/phosphatase family protein [Nocardioides sp.]|uniref:endonuclease/exonuclease/phosphatase family protein n=1 Tax=Nocardioides sp. TaxID=35761 RepID=UPI0019BDC772|nr:endonuclease/exonuclease/phosphatase family protein [Nocardioides sp.]MBC7279054.1 endonuclease/exonuclease/phosphatase family protein [Nocardioides sp.]